MNSKLLNYVNNRIVTISVLGLNLFYFKSDYSIFDIKFNYFKNNNNNNYNNKNNLDYTYSKYLQKYVKNDDSTFGFYIDKENLSKNLTYFKKCFNALFCPAYPSHTPMILITNAIVLSYFEKRLGKVPLLKCIFAAYIGTVLAMIPDEISPSNSSISYNRMYNDNVFHNYQLYNIPLLALFSMVFTGQLSSIVVTAVYGMLILRIFNYVDFIFDTRVGIFFSLLMHRTILIARCKKLCQYNNIFVKTKH